jgi:hypothetical protein
MEEPSRSEVNDDDDYVESDDDYVGNDQFDDDMELDSYIEAYPESKLVYLQSKTSRSKKVKNEINNLKHMKSVDDEFKMRLYLEEDLQRLYLYIHTDQISLKDITTEEKKLFEEIENGLVYRVQFAVRQRRLVTDLEKQGLLANSKKAWEDATFGLTEVSKIVWVWHTERLLPISMAILTELNCGMGKDDFNSGVRQLLTQVIDAQDIAAIMEEDDTPAEEDDTGEGGQTVVMPVPLAVGGQEDTRKGEEDDADMKFELAGGA